MNHSQTQFWSIPSAEMLEQLQTTPQGLRSDEIQERLLRYGPSIQDVGPQNFLMHRHDSLHHLLKPHSKEVGCDVLVGLGSLV